LNTRDNITSASTANEKDLLQLLDIILQMMLLTETVEDFKIKNLYNRQLIKNVLNKALSVIVPIVEKDYPLVFKAGQEDALKIISKYEKMIAFIRDLNVPQKEKLIEMIEAYNYDRGVMDATIHRIIKKHNK
jgi:hypothetical protein